MQQEKDLHFEKKGCGFVSSSLNMLKTACESSTKPRLGLP